MRASKRINIRVTPEQAERWKARAAAERLTVTDFIVKRIDGVRIAPEVERVIEQRAVEAVVEQAERVVAAKVEEMIESAVERQLQGFDPVAFQHEIQSLIAQRGNGGRRGEIALPSECKNADEHHQFSPEFPCPFCGATG